jgi:hypothetical protein
VIDFVHAKVLDALEVVTREEKNKSLQSLYKELNDHTTNTFEFGKNFLAYLLSTSKKVGVDLVSSGSLNGRSMETGRLHRLLEKATESVMKGYVAEMRASEERIETMKKMTNQAVSSSNSRSTNNAALNQPAAAMQMTLYNASSSSTSGMANRGLNDGGGGAMVEGIQGSFQAPVVGGAAGVGGFLGVGYDISVIDYEESKLLSTVYIIQITDPLGHCWVIRRKFADFKSLHKEVEGEYFNKCGPSLSLTLPPKIKSIVPSATDYDERCTHIQTYIYDLIAGASGSNISSRAKQIVCKFLETKSLMVSESTTIQHAENVPNYFIEMKYLFQEQLVYTGKTNAAATNGKSNNSNNNSDSKYGTGTRSRRSSGSKREGGDLIENDTDDNDVADGNSGTMTAAAEAKGGAVVTKRGRASGALNSLLSSAGSAVSGAATRSANLAGKATAVAFCRGRKEEQESDNDGDGSGSDDVQHKNTSGGSTELVVLGGGRGGGISRHNGEDTEIEGSSSWGIHGQSYQQSDCYTGNNAAESKIASTSHSTSTSTGAAPPSSTPTPMSKDMMKFRLNWGVEWSLKVFDAYALLQRMATVLSWNLEINHFFISMFGNTVAFSKLPLQEILMTLKGILSKFLVLASELFRYACQLNAEQEYNWHKNLQMTEQQLKMVKHHADKALALISKIGEHLNPKQNQNKTVFTYFTPSFLIKIFISSPTLFFLDHSILLFKCF